MSRKKKAKIVNSLLDLTYDDWKTSCENMQSVKYMSKKAYLQWFPYSRFTIHDWKYIKSKNYFDSQIKNGAFAMNGDWMFRTDHYLQKPDGSFRNAKLVSPILFLLLNAIGKNISRLYKSNRPKEFSAYYSGNFSKNVIVYKNEYKKFCSEIDSSISSYDYYIKTDITNFYDNINIDRLLAIVEDNCNSDNKNISALSMQIYGELLKYIGRNKYPTVENNTALSYLATIVYLDKIDQEIAKYIKENFEDIEIFKCIRYVDDMYILMRSRSKNFDANKIYNRIRNYYSTLLKEVGLTINSKKTIISKINNIQKDIQKTVYFDADGEYISKVHSDDNLLNKFLQELNLKSKESTLTQNDYNEIVEKNFFIENSVYSSRELFNYYLYSSGNQLLTKTEYCKLIEEIYVNQPEILNLDPKRLGRLMLSTRDEYIIKNILNGIFVRSKEKVSNAYDIELILMYLMQRDFKHKDLKSKLSKALYRYIICFCDDASNRNVYVKNEILKRIEAYIDRDAITYYLYMMYKFRSDSKEYFSEIGYFVSYFDRLTADFAYKKGITNKLNINRYYKRDNIVKLYDSSIETNKKILKNLASNLGKRNMSPQIHSSSELITDMSKEYKSEIEQSIFELNKVIVAFLIENKL